MSKGRKIKSVAGACQALRRAIGSEYCSVHEEVTIYSDGDTKHTVYRMYTPDAGWCQSEESWELCLAHTMEKHNGGRK